MLRNYIIILLGIFLIGNLHAQQQSETPRKLVVRGISEYQMEPLSRANINLYEGSNKIKTIQSGSDGSFSLDLEMNKQYVIEVEKDGLVGKKISFNTQLPDDEKGTWMNEFSVNLVKPCKGIDYSILKEPVDKVAFDSRRREFISDKNYVNSMRPKIEDLMVKTDQCQLSEYENVVKKADQAAKANNLTEALNLYREAQSIYPTEEYPVKRIGEINNVINRQQGSAEAYKKLIADADALASQGKLADALQKYNQASAFNPQETYPKQKAAELQNTLAQQQAARQAQQSVDDKYNQAMAKASVAYTKKDYTAAKQFYQEALTVKPSEALPKSRVQEIETIQAKQAAELAARNAEAQKKEAFEKEYIGLVEQADALFKAKKFEEAKTAYVKACEMKPSESYPAQRIKSANTAIASEKAAADKVKNDSYDNAMTSGNNALAKEQFAMAKDAFQKALAVKPDDADAKSKLAETDRLSDEFSKRKAAGEQYNSAIQAGDAFMAQKNWNSARESYNKALAIRPDDKTALSRITAVDNSVAAEQAALLKTKNDGFNTAMAAGNVALSKNQFTEAKAAYQKALSIKPDEQAAKDKITETDRLAAAYQKQKELNDQYAKVIATADGYMASKKLEDARNSYQQALALKPEDSYAQSKIASIDNSIAAENAARLKSVEDSYKAAVGAAQTAITQKTYTQAKEFIQKALAVKPGDAYATAKSAEIDRLIADQKKKEEQDKLLAQQYNDKISSADKLFGSKDYPAARSGYTAALAIKPGDAYANQKITEIDNLVAAEALSKQQKLESDFTQAMSQGSAATLAKNYPAAQEAFQKALALKPADNNARQKLNETLALIKQEQERVLAEQNKKKKFDETVKAADQLFNQKNWNGAKTTYEQALALYPAESYPRQKLDEIKKTVDEQNRIMAENAARENAFSLAMASGDKFYLAKDYDQAKNEYTRASGIKPDAAQPKTKLAEIEKLIAQRQKEQADAKARTAAYTAAMNTGNDAFTKKDYVTAKASYTEALKQIPGDALALDQIKKTDYVMAEAEKIRQAAEAKKAAFESLIGTADQAFDGARYAMAKENYQKALAIDPSSAYAKQRIARIDEINKMLSQAPPKTNTQAAAVTQKTGQGAQLAELNFKNESERQLYLNELKNKYPEGITLEKYKQQYKIIFRYIVIRDNEAQEFRQVKYTSYQDQQFSVNGKPITQQYFLSQTKVRQGESFKEIEM